MLQYFDSSMLSNPGGLRCGQWAVGSGYWVVGNGLFIVSHWLGTWGVFDQRFQTMDSK